MMAKKTSKMDNHKAGATLKFVASLIFLYVLFTGLGSGTWGNYATGSLWSPLLLAAALLGSICLFFGSLMEIVKPKMCMGSKPVMLVAFCLVALTVGPLFSSLLWMSIVGFVIGWAGSAVERM
jgi:hypothetical protein